MASAYKVGQSIVVKIGVVTHEATVRAVVDHTDGLKLIADR
jgi:hypothetical protein